MWERNGIPGLEVCSPDEVERAATLFHRDGFVAISDAMPVGQLERLRAAAADVIEQLVAADPQGAVGGGAGGLPHRYSFGGTSASRHMFHRPEWCELIDMPTTTPILTAIFGSPNYIVYGAGGDMAFPGAIEYQGLHSDNVWTELHDPVGGVYDARSAGAGGAHQLPDRRSDPGERADPPDPRHAPLAGADPAARRRARVDAVQHGLPAARRFGDHPRRPLLARRHTQPLTRRAGDAERRVLRTVVPQRGA